MTFHETLLKGSYIIELEPFTDDRGWFARTFCQDEFGVKGLATSWVQLNHSFTTEKGTIRGMHFQMAPFTEVKLVRCIAGAVYDVIIDLREGSPTQFQFCATELSAANRKMLYIPEGFAHGFQALTGNCELIYHHTAMYTPGVEGGIRYNDPTININWPLPVSNISTRDNVHPDLDATFKGL